MSNWEDLDDQLRWPQPNNLNLECTGVSHLDCVSRVLQLALWTGVPHFFLRSSPLIDCT